MAEKILNTRILNKIDTLENWNSSTLPLKKGELALATVAASAGTGLTEPVVMVKIGEDGIKTFKDLPWNFYAKAADVLAACKTEAGLTEFVNNVIANAGIASDEAMNALANRVTTVENDLNTASTGLKARMTAVEGLVGDTAVATQISNAIAALKLGETYAAKVHIHTKADITDFAHTHAISEVTDLQTKLDEAKKAGTDANTALEAYKVTNNAAVSANTAAIAAINNETTGILATAKAYADGKDAAIAAAKKAGDDAQADVDALEAKVGTVPADKTVVQMISEAQTAATYDDTQIKKDIKANADAIDVLEGYVGGEAVSTQIQTAITALNLATTYEAKGAAAAVKTELVGKDTDTAASATITGAKKYADSLDTAMDARVDVLEAAIGEGGSVATQITTEIQKLDKADTAVAGQYVSAVSETDGIITVTREALPDYTNTYAPKTHTHAIADVTGLQGALDGKADDGDVTALDGRVTTAEGKLTTLIGTDTGKSVRTIANEELVAQLIPETAKASLDTLQEIAAWIQAHPDDASAMNTRITDLETLVGDDPVSTQINAAIDALKIGDYAKAADLTAAVGRITTLEGKAHEHANKALLDTYTQTEANLADAVAKKHAHANATVLDGISAEKVTAWDAAVQTVTAGTGLKAVKTGTDVALDIDDTVVWVFDCGNSVV